MVKKKTADASWVPEDVEVNDAFSTTLSGHVADCGPNSMYLFLSREAALQNKRKNHIGHPHTSDDDGSSWDFRPYSILSSNFGQHSLSLSFVKRFCRHRLFPILRAVFVDHEPSVLEGYSLGLELYFKFLKFSCVLFWGLSIFSIPPIFFYQFASSVNDESSSTSFNDGGVSAALFASTLGALGEGSVICDSFAQGEVRTLQCDSAGTTISEIKMWYGQPKGTCGCPEDMLLPSNGVCAGTVLSDGERDCPETAETGCYKGNSPTTSAFSCCARELDESSSAPDFSTIQFEATPGCDSNTAQRIAEEMCLGRSECVLDTYGNYTVGETELSLEDSPGTDFWNCSAHAVVAPRGVSADAELWVHVQASCFAPKISIGGVFSVDRGNLTLGLSVLDSLMALVFFVGVVWLSKKEHHEAAEVDLRECTPADYTVQISNFPLELTLAEQENALVEFVETTLTAVFRVHKELPGGVKVADVNFVLNNTDHIAMLCKRGGVARKLDRANARLYIMKKHENTPKSLLDRKSGEVKKLREELRTMNKNLKALIASKNEEAKAVHATVAARKEEEEAAGDEEEGSRARFAEKKKKKKRAEQEEEFEPFHAVSAFVTFDDVEGYDRCLREFPDLGVVGKMLRPALKMGGRALQVRPAVEPTELVWQNLDMSTRKRAALHYGRCAASIFATFALLGCSIFIIHQFRSHQTTSASLENESVNCDRFEVVEHVAQYEGSFVPIDNAAVLDDYNAERGNVGLVECFCAHVWLEDGFDEMLEYEFDGGRLCFEWRQSIFWRGVLKLTSAASVVAINAALCFVLKQFAVREAHGTVTECKKSIFEKFFFASVVNIGLIALLVNANLEIFGNEGAELSFLSTIGLFEGDYDDFGDDWFRDVAPQILLTMLLMIFSSHVFPMLLVVKVKAMHWIDQGFSSNAYRTKKTTQEDLNALYLGPEFCMEYNYARALTFVFVAMVYSAGMPIILPITAIALTIDFWVSKAAILRLYRTPPKLNEAFPFASTSTLPFAALLHCMCALWMFSNDDLVTQLDTDYAAGADDGDVWEPVSAVGVSVSSSITGRIVHRNSVCLFALWLFILAYLVLDRFLIHVLGHQAVALLKSFTLIKWLLSKKDVEQEKLPTYFQAISSEVLQRQIKMRVLRPKILAKYLEEHNRRKKIAVMSSAKRRWQLAFDTHGDQLTSGAKKESAVDKILHTFGANKKRKGKIDHEMEDYSSSSGNEEDDSSDDEDEGPKDKKVRSKRFGGGGGKNNKIAPADDDEEDEKKKKKPRANKAGHGWFGKNKVGDDERVSGRKKHAMYYKVLYKHGVAERERMDVDSERTGKVMKCGQIFEVSQKVSQKPGKKSVGAFVQVEGSGGWLFEHEMGKPKKALLKPVEYHCILDDEDASDDGDADDGKNKKEKKQKKNKGGSGAGDGDGGGGGLAGELLQLTKLKDEGVLNKKEFAAAKAKMLDVSMATNRHKGRGGDKKKRGAGKKSQSYSSSDDDDSDGSDSDDESDEDSEKESKQARRKNVRRTQIDPRTLESYNFEANPDYLAAFALGSECLLKLRVRAKGAEGDADDDDEGVDPNETLDARRRRLRAKIAATQKWKVSHANDELRSILGVGGGLANALKGEQQTKYARLVHNKRVKLQALAAFRKMSPTWQKALKDSKDPLHATARSALAKAALAGAAKSNARCPKCTMPLPCKCAYMEKEREAEDERKARSLFKTQKKTLRGHAGDRIRKQRVAERIKDDAKRDAEAIKKTARLEAEQVKMRAEAKAEIDALKSTLNSQVQQMQFSNDMQMMQMRMQQQGNAVAGAGQPQLPMTSGGATRALRGAKNELATAQRMKREAEEEAKKIKEDAEKLAKRQRKHKHKHKSKSKSKHRHRRHGENEEGEGSDDDVDEDESADTFDDGSLSRTTIAFHAAWANPRETVVDQSSLAAAAKKARRANREKKHHHGGDDGEEQDSKKPRKRHKRSGSKKKNEFDLTSDDDDDDDNDDRRRLDNGRERMSVFGSLF